MVTINGTPDVLMDGVITRAGGHAGQRAGARLLTVTGKDLTAVMDLIDFSGMPFPAMPIEARVALILAKYAMFGVVPMVIPTRAVRGADADREDPVTSRAPTSSTSARSPRRSATCSTSSPGPCRA